MYFNVYKASTYSYTDKNFKTLKEVKEYLKISESLTFKRDSCTGELVAEVNGWTVTLKKGNMPDKGEGYVDMLYESGALEDCY